MNDLVQHVTDEIVKEQSIEKLFRIIFLDILGRYCGKYSDLDRAVFRCWFLHSHCS